MNILSWPAVFADMPLSMYPDFHSGDLVFIDQPLPSWKHPIKRFSKWMLRINKERKGIKVYVLIEYSNL
jgi:hypothetical protein